MRIKGSPPFFSLYFWFTSLQVMYSTSFLLYLSLKLNWELQTGQSMDFNLENPLTNSHELHFDTTPSLFLIESDHMPSKNYLKTLKEIDFDVSFRREAISSVLRVSGKNVKHNSLLYINSLYIHFLISSNILFLVIFSGFLQLRSVLVLSCC